MIEPRDPQTAPSGSQSDEHHVPGGDAAPRPRWALYARSGGAVRDQANGQLVALRAYAERHGVHVVAELVDLGRSRRDRDRAFELVEAGEVDRVVVVQLDRLGRLVEDVALWVDAFDGHAAALWILRGLVGNGEPAELTSPLNKAIFNIFNELARAEERYTAEVGQQQQEEGNRRRANNNEA
ncbi:recombinase family protein [Nonomuraea sp. NEAU-A123]|uniref:recombinase family protein n=1 Tax=Nonomuraea sp. NEAU-A123 TaxID=2839649 RepID=UPI001BE4C853|nr:recombinase family protein [Nonomuraea sp. NEAU-A123]